MTAGTLGRSSMLAAALAAVVADFRKDRIPLVAAGTTFYALLAIFPALSCFASIYGFFANVGDVRHSLAGLSRVLPGGAIDLIGGELGRLTHTDRGSLGLAFVAGLAISLWSATAGVKALIQGLNVAYEVRERRGFIALNLIAFALTLGALALAVSAGWALAAVSDWRISSPTLAQAAAVLSWPGLVAVAAGLLALAYRFGPSNQGAGRRVVAPGAVTAAVVWTLMSAGFTWYVAHFGRYDKIYGSLGAAVGFLTWLWLSLAIVLAGAELNSELQRLRAAG